MIDYILYEDTDRRFKALCKRFFPKNIQPIQPVNYWQFILRKIKGWI